MTAAVPKGQTTSQALTGRKQAIFLSRVPVYCSTLFCSDALVSPPNLYPPWIIAACKRVRPIYISLNICLGVRNVMTSSSKKLGRCVFNFFAAVLAPLVMTFDGKSMYREQWSNLVQSLKINKFQAKIEVKERFSVRLTSQADDLITGYLVAGYVCLSEVRFSSAFYRQNLAPL